jgi:predicted ester cyclase
MTERELGLGLRWFEEVWNQGRREAIAEMVAPDAIIHEGGVDSVGPAGFYPYFDRMQAAFSNIRVKVHDTLVADDKICLRWSCTMKHTGDGLGMPATGRTLETTGISIMRVAGNKFVEGWQNWDLLGLLRQIEGRSKAAIYTGASKR